MSKTEVIHQYLSSQNLQDLAEKHRTTPEKQPPCVNTNGIDNEYLFNDAAPSKLSMKASAAQVVDPITSKSALLQYYELHHVALDFIMGAIRAMLSDVISQFIAYHYHSDRQHIRWSSPFISACISLCYMTPILLVFFHYLSIADLTKRQRIAIDQFIFAPVYSSGIISLRLYWIQSIPSHQIVEQVMHRLPSAMLYGWLFWIPSKFFLHEYIDMKYHLLVSQFLSLVWNTVLACIV